jgi:predicted esterase
MPETFLLRTPTTGRYLVESAPCPGAPLLVGFHGYGQKAEDMLADLRRIPGAEAWTLVAVQALHRFYSSRTMDVVGSWMTSLDRDEAIEDNVAYVTRVVEGLRERMGSVPLVFAGFSQGAAMAWRAAARCGPCQGLIVLGGDLPGDVAEGTGLGTLPVLLGRGDQDGLYPARQLDKDVATLESLGLKPEVVRFDGGHEWGEGFLQAAGGFLARVREEEGPMGRQAQR